MKIYKQFLLAALLMALAVSVSAAPIIIPRDTVIPVTMDKTISSATNRAGNTFYVHQAGINGEGFPDNTRFTGNIVSVTKASGKTAGQIGVKFLGAKLPNGSKVPIIGRLTSLDEADTKTDPDTGRLVGATTGGNKDLKFIAIGAGAGALIGQFTTQRPIKGTLIGAAAGYLYSRTQTKAAVGKNVQVASGTRFGIILDQDVIVPGSITTATPASLGAGSNSGPGWLVNFDNLQPLMSGNNLMVPFRSVMNSINMPFDYDPAIRQISVNNYETQSLHTVGSRIIDVDGHYTGMDTASRIINDSLYVPANYIELLTGRTAYWNQKSGIMRIE